MDNKFSKLPTNERKLYEDEIRSKDMYGVFVPPVIDQSPAMLERPQSVNEWKHMVSWNRIINPSKLFQGKKHKVHILPIGPFPEVFKETTMKYSLEQAITQFLEIFFPGFLVVFMDPVDHKNIKCKTRIYPKSKQKQLMIGDVQTYLASIKPKSATCICGLSWFDFYPSEELNHILGEASFENSTLAVSFGHYAFYKQKNAEYNNRWGKDFATEQSVSLTSSLSDESYIYVTEGEKQEADMRLPDHDIVCTNDPQSPSTPTASIKKVISSLKIPGDFDLQMSTSPVVFSGDEISELTTRQAEDFEFVDQICSESSCDAVPHGCKFALDCKIFRKMFRVLTHEICHTLGMAHCQYYNCTMNMSASVLHAISQPLLLCPVCLRKLQLHLKMNLRSRYENMYNMLIYYMPQFCKYHRNDREECPFVADKQTLQKILEFMGD